MTKNNYAALHSRVHPAMKEKIEEIAEKREKTRSELLRNILYEFIDHNEEIELSDTMKKVTGLKDQWMELMEEDLLIQKSNEMASVRLKQETYIEYIDQFVAHIYRSNRDYIEDDDELREKIRNAMDVLAVRAEHHGVKEEFEKRHEKPIECAKRYLSRKAKDDDAFYDWMDFVGAT